MKKFLLVLFALSALFLTGCYETITGYELVGEYQSSVPLGYWGDSKLSYNQNGNLKLSIALEKSTLSEFSEPQLEEVKLSGKTNLSVKNIIRQQGLSSFEFPIFFGLMSPYLHLRYEDSQLKEIVRLEKNSHLQILNAQDWSVKNEMKVDKFSDAFIKEITYSEDLQYLAIAYCVKEPLDHIIEIYRLNNKNKTYQFHRIFDCRTEYHSGMFFDNMAVDNNMLIIRLVRGTRSTIKTSKLVFYNLKNDSVECEYIKTNHSFVRAAAVTPDHKYLIITDDTIRLYRRTSDKK